MSQERTHAEFAESAEQQYIDRAYILAIGGNSSLASTTDGYYQAAIKAAANCMDVNTKLKGSTPSPGEVADHMEEPTLVDLHLCAEMLEGDLSVARKAAKYGHKTLQMAGAALGSPFALTATVLRLKGHEQAGAVAEGFGKVMHVPARIAEGAVGRQPSRLVTAARHYVAATYGKHEEAYGAPTNAAWLWATLVSRTAGLPDQLSGIPNYFGGKFLDSIGRLGRSIDELPVPLRSLALHLSNNPITAETSKRFIETVKTPEHTVRTRKELLAELAESDKNYHEALALSADQMRFALKITLDRLTDEPNSIQAHQQVTELFAAAVERANAHGVQSLAYEDLLDEHFDPMALAAYRYILKAQNVEGGEASIAALRLLTDVLLNKGIDILADSARKQLEQNFNKAAFDWFGHPYQTFKYNKDAVTFMREAYLLDRLRNGQSEPNQFNAARAARFLHAAQMPKAEIVAQSRRFEPLFNWAYESLRQ